MGELMRIGEIASAAGVSPRTVDYYTSLHLLTPAERSPGNFRLYDPSIVERITTIRQLESHGVPLDDIARALHSPHAQDLTTLLARLDADLHTLQETAETAGPDTYRLLTAAAARAHSLITTALEIALGITPG
ncbi:DNA-binding transcriptional MerR regulator [Krasilnikovia cinnamomea]|uniref:DNA-binding transcriptional MerR regulator n=1 Tax=Krasilnikovia cinnamomea TaxID=349313 RepID=A0A4Q7ZSV1_9ACTN|nr:MerR family transcriptional regulator [Krasilnikovia cinnamomea]RZU54288.1 DNA-binding transcriptional MerR regulator [Krasilnikovia cinnamomea]